MAKHIKKRKVIFRRIRGRIVPIRIKDERVKSAGLAALGIAGAVTGGVIAGKTFKAGRETLRAGAAQAREAKKFLTAPLFIGVSSKKFKRAARRAAAGGIRKAVRGVRLQRFGLGIGAISALVGSGLVSLGVEKLTQQQRSEVKAFAIGASGAAASFATGVGIRSALLKKKRGRLLKALTGAAKIRFRF